MQSRSVSLLALLAMSFGLGACDSRQDELAARRQLPPPDSRACVRQVKAGVQFAPGGCLRSPNGAYALVMRHSGALDIVTAKDAATQAKAIWTTGSRGARPDSAFAIFQGDGNLVIYDQPGSRAIWNSQSAGPPGDYELKLSDSGDLTISNSAGKTVWSSGFGMASCVIGLAGGSQLPVGSCVAAPSKTYALVMSMAGSLDLAPVEPDGSLSEPIWTSGSRAASAGSASGAFQTDGNLVVYDQPGSRPIWSSMSNDGQGEYRLQVSDAGEAEILDAAGKMIWSSKTGRADKT